MQNIATAGLFDWIKVTTGTGTIQEKSDGWECDGGASGVAFFRKNLPARPGEKITVSVLARLVNGTPGSEPAIVIDYPAYGHSKNIVPVTSAHWEQYSISFTVPLTAKVDSEIVSLVIGSFTGRSGTIDIGNVGVMVENAVTPMARVCAAALIVFGSDGVSLNKRFCTIGIKGLRLSSDQKTLYVDIGKLPYPSDDYPGLGPICNVQVTRDTPAIFARVGNYARDTGEIAINIYDNASGGSVMRDFTAGTPNPGGNGFIWFTAFGP